MEEKKKDNNGNIYNDVYTYNITIMDYIKRLIFFFFSNTCIVYKTLKTIHVIVISKKIQNWN